MDVEFSPDGRRIASMSYLVGSDPTESVDGNRYAGIMDASQLRITDADSGRPVVDGLTELGYAVFDLAFSPDGQRVAFGSADGKIRVRDADTGAAVGAPLSGHTEAVSALAYSRERTRSSAAATIRSTCGQPNPINRSETQLPGLAFVGSAARRGQP